MDAAYEANGNKTFGDSIDIRTHGLGPAGRDGVRRAPRDTRPARVPQPDCVLGGLEQRRRQSAQIALDR